MSAILDPPFWKMEIWCQIRNQRPQKPWSTKFHGNRWVAKILCPPYWVRHFEFRKSNVRFRINDLKSFWVQSFAEIMWFPKLHVWLVLDICHFAKGIAIWDRWDNFFLVVQLFRSSLIIVRIESQYSFGSKKNYEKKYPIFWYFSPNLAPYWISYWTKLNFDPGFLKSIPKTIRKHGFRLEISPFQSWEWGLNISYKILVLGR